tara:strand:- start:179 stop:325 length:147 start_codon:yes stop_codon:yes gene_type:complete
MKKIKIPIEFFFQLYGKNLIKNGCDEKMTKEDKLIERNKKYFNEIGIA